MELFKGKLDYSQITEQLSIRKIRELSEAEIRFLEKREKQRELLMRQHEERQAALAAQQARKNK